MVGTVTFSVKRSNPPHTVGAQYAVDVSGKRSTPHAVGAQYAVAVSAKRSNMCDGDHYL